MIAACLAVLAWLWFGPGRYYYRGSATDAVFFRIDRITGRLYVADPTTDGWKRLPLRRPTRQHISPPRG